jgi:hypothetical protein
MSAVAGVGILSFTFHHCRLAACRQAVFASKRKNKKPAVKCTAVYLKTFILAGIIYKADNLIICKSSGALRFFGGSFDGVCGFCFFLFLPQRE